MSNHTIGELSHRTNIVLRGGLFDNVTVRQARKLIDGNADLTEQPITQRLFFGCENGHAGHYFFTPGRDNYVKAAGGYLKVADRLPFDRIDGGLVPSGREVEGLAKLSHKEGWTALAFCDRSVDKRGGSNAVFFADAYRSFDAMLADAQEHWPSIFARFNYEIVNVDDS